MDELKQPPMRRNRARLWIFIVFVSLGLTGTAMSVYGLRKHDYLIRMAEMDERNAAEDGRTALSSLHPDIFWKSQSQSLAHAASERSDADRIIPVIWAGGVMASLSALFFVIVAAIRLAK